jgi:hypothetical protein
VPLVGLLAQPPDMHILDHSLAQRGGLLLLPRNLLYDGWEDPDRQPGKASHQEQR